MIKRNCLNFIVVIIFGCLFLSLPVYGGNETTPENAPEVNNSNSSIQIVDIEVAKAVAADYLPKYYKGKWVFFDYFICYDLNGLPAAYAIVFRKPDSCIKSYKELNDTLQNIREKRDKILGKISQTKESDELSEDVKKRELINLRKIVNRQKRALYQANSFATVITGATEISTLLIRCYIGLPTFIAKKADIEAKLATQYPDKKLQLGRILYFSPADIRYEVKEGAQPILSASAAKRGEQTLKQKISGDYYTISKDKKNLLKVSIERQKLKERLDEIKKALEKMNSKNRKMIEERDKKRKQHFMKKWTKYKRKHLDESEKAEGEEVKK